MFFLSSRIQSCVGRSAALASRVWPPTAPQPWREPGERATLLQVRLLQVRRSACWRCADLFPPALEACGPGDPGVQGPLCPDWQNMVLSKPAQDGARRRQASLPISSGCRPITSYQQQLLERPLTSEGPCPGLVSTRGHGLGAVRVFRTVIRFCKFKTAACSLCQHAA